jgi:hypothetical protein
MSGTSKSSFSPWAPDFKKMPRLPNTQQNRQSSSSKVSQVLKNNKSDPNLTKDSRQILTEQGSPIEYLQRFKTKRDENASMVHPQDESSLAETFADTVFNPPQQPQLKTQASSASKQNNTEGGNSEEQ